MKRKTNPCFLLIPLLILLLISSCKSSGGSSGGSSSSSSSSSSRVADTPNVPAPSVVTDCNISICEASSLERYGIQWTFSDLEEYGQFANGDYWVLDNGAGVTIISISPASTNIFGRIQHGSMLNPTESESGYDSTMGASYNASLNVGRPNGLDLSNENPLTITGGNSLVSSRTNDTPNTRPQLVDASVLTIVSSRPPVGSFRPPYSGTDKSFNWNVSDIQWNKLPALSKASVDSVPILATLQEKIENVWLDHGGGSWTGRYYHPSNNMPDYGRDMAIITGDVALALMLDFTQTELEPLMYSFLQLGIDWYGITENRINIITTTTQGGLWMGGGGHGHGRQWPMLFTGLMFDDDNILKYMNGITYPIFQEQQQHFYVTRADVDRERYTADGRPREPYLIGDIGLAEWGEQHTNQPQRDGNNWDAYYRSIVSMSIPGHSLAAILMSSEAVWGNTSFFDYQDRWSIYQKSVGENLSYSSFTNSMWDIYR